MDIASLLARMEADPSYAGQLSHVEVLPERPVQFAEPDEHLPETVRRFARAVAWTSCTTGAASPATTRRLERATSPG